MSLPRQVLPSSTYLLTRRCSERRYFLRPSPLTNQIVLYAMAVAAARTGVRVHGFCAMSTHIHLVATDPDARLPVFMQMMNSLVARALNASYGRFEAFWEAAGSSYSAVRLESPAAVLDKLVYVLANPVESGLVRHAYTWPGLWSHPHEIMREPLRVVRPMIFFRDEERGGALPAVASLRLERPPGQGMGDDELRALVEARLAAREAEVHEQFRIEGRSFLGRKGVLAQRPTDSPATREPRRGLDPRVAEPDPARRQCALRRLVTFWADYRAARRRLRDGDLGVVFPAGTYALRLLLRVRCADTA